MKRGSFHLRPWAVTAILTLGLAACTGSAGPAGPSGTPAVDRGSIAGTVKDGAGAPIASAAVSTDPATTTAQTDAAGTFTLTSIPVGAYRVTASKSGYVDGSLTGVGVGAGGTVNVSLVLASVPPTIGSLSGTVLGRKGTAGTSSPVAGATVCVQGTSTCSAATQADGKYTLSGVTPGFLFVLATAPGYLAGENREAVFLAAGAAVTGVDVTLSGVPASTATYLGSSACVACHTGVTPGVVSAWQGSAHARAIARDMTQVDPAAWAGVTQEPNCTSTANARDVGFTAPDPTVATAPFDREVFLVRYAAACSPAFAMALDTNGNGIVDPADTVIPVTATVGGVATGAGQCGNGGIIPANALCSGGSAGWWQQEYLVGIGPGASKPAWVTWDTTATPSDMLVLPAAWNQRARAWAPAPDYYPSFSSATPPSPRDGTTSKNCSGCHEAGLSLAVDASGNVTSYSARSPDIGCEKCHGPGSSHQAAGGDAQLIVHPAFLTAQSEREVCGQCHSQGVASMSPAGVFGFAWNDAAAVGGGNFIPGVHVLSDFQSAPAFGDPDFYWPSGFPSSDHETFIDFGANVHANNPFERLTCATCHSGHGGTGGPVQIQKTSAAGAVYDFQNNEAVLRDDVACLVCHATFGPFASVALEDVANYHIMEGGAVLKNATAMSPTADVQAASESLIASAVNGHMMDAAKMPAYFDPTGAVSGMPVGRCSSCHMAKTAFTGTFFSGLDSSGRTANVIGDVSAHTFKVAWPDMSLATWTAATTWDGVMPNACGSCHAVYRFGK